MCKCSLALAQNKADSLKLFDIWQVGAIDQLKIHILTIFYISICYYLVMNKHI